MVKQIVIYTILHHEGLTRILDSCKKLLVMNIVSHTQSFSMNPFRLVESSIEPNIQGFGKWKILHVIATLVKQFIFRESSSSQEFTESIM